MFYKKIVDVFSHIYDILSICDVASLKKLCPQVYGSVSGACLSMAKNRGIMDELINNRKHKTYRCGYPTHDAAAGGPLANKGNNGQTDTPFIRVVRTHLLARVQICIHGSFNERR